LERKYLQSYFVKAHLVQAFQGVKQVIKEVIPAQNQRSKAMKLELEIIRSKQHYQDTGDVFPPVSPHCGTSVVKHHHQKKLNDRDFVDARTDRGWQH